MKKIIPLIAALLIAFPLAGQGKRYKVDDIPNVHLQDSRRFVSNPDGVLSKSAVYRMDTMLYSLKQSGRAQAVVVAVNSIGNADPTDFLFKLLEKWGVGRKDTDNGLGIMLVIDQGAIEILTGYGLEGDLPDALAKRVINNYMIPAFRNKDWDGGMTAGVEAIKDILEGAVPEDLQAETGGSGGWVIIAALAMLLFIPVIVVLMVALLSNRCPRCKKRKLKRVSTQMIKKGGRKVQETTYVCQNCGYVVKRDQNLHNGGGSGMGPIIVGGGMGRGGGSFGSGGGRSGGSFGGGSFGGGGARGRF